MVNGPSSCQRRQRTCLTNNRRSVFTDVGAGLARMVLLFPTQSFPAALFESDYNDLYAVKMDEVKFKLN